MKLQILSDLHLDHAPLDAPRVGADVLVVAGDCYDDGVASVRWCQRQSRRLGIPVVFVPGNHDFYGASMGGRLRAMLHACRGSAVFVLHNRSVVLGDVRIVGTPLWTDLAGSSMCPPAIASHAAETLTGDYLEIRAGTGEGARPLSADYVRRMHSRALRALDAGLENACEEKVVVVTHHAPVLSSLPASLADSALGASFASDLEEYVRYSFAQAWVHGHVHHSVDRMVGGTRVLCNPRGSGQYQNLDFAPGFILDV